MKKLVSILLICLCNISYAQRGRIAIIDSKFIMSKMPEYQEANKEMQKRDAAWQLVIERKRKEIKDLKDQLNVERPLLTQQLIEEKEEDIQIIEKELLEFQNEKYNSQDGDYFRQKLSLAKPLQDQINTIVKEIAERKRYTMVVDKATSSETAVMYINRADEISDQVLRRLEQARNKSKMSKREIAELDAFEEQLDVRERQRYRRDELEHRQRLLEEQKEQEQALSESVAPNPIGETPREKMMREREEKLEAAKKERERLREERLKEIEERKKEAERIRDERIKAAEERKANLLEKRQRLAEERKKKAEEARQQRLKEIENRTKGVGNRK